jgi:hypothetical protein
MPEFNDPAIPQDTGPTPDAEPEEISRRRLVVGGLAAVGAVAVAAGTLGRAATAVAAQDPRRRRSSRPTPACAWAASPVK